MQIHVNPNDKQPVYLQIKSQIAEAIAADRLRPGDELIPERVLAEQLIVSPSSVERAYAELTEDGLCESEDSGIYQVATVDEKTKRQIAWRTHLASQLEREPLLRELELARDIQTRLLPPSEIDGDGFSIVSRSAPAGIVSGDFYDVVRSADSHLNLVVGDVSGKGFGASLIMASVKAMLPFLVTDLSVEATLKKLNQRLFDRLESREFVALALARFSPETGEVELANAGLPDPFLVTSTAQPEAIEVPGPRFPLGLRSSVEYHTLNLSMDHGARLLLYSDGLPEAQTRGGAPLGYEAFGELLGTTLGDSQYADPNRKPLAQWLDSFLAKVRQATSEDSQDDWTALVIERR